MPKSLGWPKNRVRSLSLRQNDKKQGILTVDSENPLLISGSWILESNAYIRVYHTPGRFLSLGAAFITAAESSSQVTAAPGLKLSPSPASSPSPLASAI